MKPKKIKGEDASLLRQIASIERQITQQEKIMFGKDLDKAITAAHLINGLFIKLSALENRLRRLKDSGFRHTQNSKFDPSFTIAR